MPEDVDFFKQFQGEAEEESNRFFADPGVNVSTALGALDLVFGAPARAVQSTLIDLVDGEDDSAIDVVSGALGNFIGIGSEGFGKGNASGIKLLKELDLLEDEENIGNIIAGAGVDIATDLASFNLIGGVRRAMTKGGSFGQLFQGSDVRVHPFTRKRKIVEDTHRSRDLTRTILNNLGKAQRKQVAGQLGGAGTRIGRFFSKNKKTGKWEIKDKHLGRIRIDEAAVRHLGDDLDKLQRTIMTPDAAKLGNVTAEDVGRAMGFTGKNLRNFKVPSGLSDAMSIRADDFAITRIRASYQPKRPSSVFDIRFSEDSFLKYQVPANLPDPLTISLTSRELSKWRIPAHWSPFDFKDVHRKTGLFRVFGPAYNRYDTHARSVLAKGEDVLKKHGLTVDTDKARRIGAPIMAGDEAGYLALSQADKAAYWDLRTVMDEIADLPYKDPKTGQVRKFLPDNQRAPKDQPYAHRVPLDSEDARSFNDNWLVETDDGFSINIRDDVPRHVHPSPFQKRAGDGIEYDPDIVKSFKAYVTSTLKKYHLEPALNEAAPTMLALRDSGNFDLYKSAQKMVGMFFGQYSDLDRYFDRLVSTIPGLRSLNGGVPNTATRGSILAANATYRAMIGLNPRTSLLQVFQGLVNNTMHLGLQDSMAGWFRKLSGTGAEKFVGAYKELRVANQLMKTLDREFLNLAGISKSTRFMEQTDKVLFSGINFMDNLNRGAAFQGGISLAKRHGMSDVQAILQGVAASNETQFIYGKLGASALRNNPLGRVMLQFQSYAAKQLAFLAGHARKDPGVNFLRYLAISGLVVRHFGDQIDVSSELTPTSPGDIKDIVSMKRIPALQGLYALWDFNVAVAQESTGSGLGQQAIDSGYAVEQLKRAVFASMFPVGTTLARAGKYLPTVTDVIPAEEKTALTLGMTRTGGKGEEIDRFGRKIRDLTTEEAVVGLAGFRSNQARIDREKVNDIRFQSQLINRQYSRYMTEAVRAQMNNKDPRPWLVEAQKIKMMKGKALMQAFKSRLRNRRLSLEERTRQRAPEVVKRTL